MSVMNVENSLAKVPTLRHIREFIVEQSLMYAVNMGKCVSVAPTLVNTRKFTPQESLWTKCRQEIH